MTKEIEQSLDSEIVDIFRGLDCASRQVSKSMIVSKVVANHSNVQGPDADFALVAVYDFTRRRVEAFWNGRIRSEHDVDQPQLPMPFEEYPRVRPAYFCNVEDERVSVPVRDLTPEQFDEKIAELRGLAAGAMQHADELEQVRNHLYPSL